MKIENGKRYVNEHGTATGIMRPSSSPVYPHTDGNSMYTSGGVWDVAKSTPNDLVSEYVAPRTDDAEFQAEVLRGRPASHCTISYIEKAEPDKYGQSIHGGNGYGPLASILQEAYEQAAGGKGKERHANGKPFLDQPIMEIARMVGVGFQTGQVQKKVQEATSMFGRGQAEAAVRELLGAINYAAAAIILIREQQENSAIAAE
jgi:hypothetical protein